MDHKITGGLENHSYKAKAKSTRRLRLCFKLTNKRPRKALCTKEKTDVPGRLGIDRSTEEILRLTKIIARLKNIFKVILKKCRRQSE